MSTHSVIGLNGQHLTITNPAGPELFTLNLYQSLTQLDTHNKYIVYFANEPSDTIKGKLFVNPNWTYKILKPYLSWTQISLAFELLKNPVDIFFTAEHTLPGLVTLLTLLHFKAVAFIHGLEYQTNQEYSNKLQLLIHPLILWWTMFFAKKIIVPSKATRDKIIKAGFPFVSQDKIQIVSEGVNKHFFADPTPNDSAILQHYKIAPHQYFFFISTIQPRKNLPRTIEAFANYLKTNARTQTTKVQMTNTSTVSTQNKQQESQPDINVNIQMTNTWSVPPHENPNTPTASPILVVAGKKGWEYQESLDAPQKYNITNKVVFLDYIPTEHIPILMHQSLGFVNFSLEEGFGLPLCEALATGATCAVSDIAAFKEVAQNYVLYANPTDTNAITTCFATLAKTHKTTKDIADQKTFAKKYSWEQSAKDILAVLESV